MDEGLRELMKLALWAASLGPRGAALMAAAGGVVLAGGFRLYRPVAALVAAGAGALSALWAIARYSPSLPVSQTVVVGAAAVLMAGIGLAWPRGALGLAAAAFGYRAGLWAGGRMPQHADVAPVAGTLVLGAAAVASHALLRTTLPPLLGSAALALGIWGYVGTSGLSPEAFRLPALWVAAFGVLAVCTVGLEQMRWRRRETAGERRRLREELKESQRREKEQRERYARYME